MTSIYAKFFGAAKEDERVRSVCFLHVVVKFGLLYYSYTPSRLRRRAEVILHWGGAPHSLWTTSTASESSHARFGNRPLS